MSDIENVVSQYNLDVDDITREIKGSDEKRLVRLAKLSVEGELAK